jgi:hypothetical protein
MIWRREKHLAYPGNQSTGPRSSPWPSHYAEWVTLAQRKYKNNNNNDNDNNNNNNNNNIDVAISGNRNVIKIEAKKILKYKDLTIEIQRMRDVKTKVISVIIGGTGTIPKSFRKYVSNIPGKHEVKELQKRAILGTAHILRKVLM